jgi:exopolysaccharide biosynthesis polyprenyl glycosylphosphotransferase
VDAAETDFGAGEAIASTGAARYRVASRERRSERLRRRMYVAELGGLFLSAAAAGVISEHTFVPRFGGSVVYCYVVVVVWLALSWLYGLVGTVDRLPELALSERLGTSFHIATVACWATFAAWATIGSGQVSITAPIALWVLTVPVVTVAIAYARSAGVNGTRSQRTIVVGAGAVGCLMARKIRMHPESGLELVGFVDSDPPSKALPAPLLGSTLALPQLVDQLEVDRVILAFSSDRDDQLLWLVRALGDRGIAVDLVPRMFEVIGCEAKFAGIEGLPLLNIPSLRLSRGARSAKRGFDIVVSAPLLLLLLPAFLIVAIAIKLDSAGPVFFRQRRIGERGVAFTILKFRTMRRDADAVKDDFAHLNLNIRNGDPRMFKIEDDPRVTRVGSFLRRYCLDELPQLANVLRGEMSLVGPRPLVPEEDEHVVEWQRRRSSLKPGMTGLWQVLGGNEIPFDEMVKLDYLYVTEWTLVSDVRLLMRTAGAVGRRRHPY